MAEQGHRRPHLLGWSWGARIAGRYVEQHPDRVDRLVLVAPAIGGGVPIPPLPSEPWRRNGPDHFRPQTTPDLAEPSRR